MNIINMCSVQYYLPEPVKPNQVNPFIMSYCDYNIVLIGQLIETRKNLRSTLKPRLIDYFRCHMPLIKP